MSRTVLVTGGSRGIGLCIARELAASGHRVAVTHRTSAPVDDLFSVRCDVTSSAEVERAFGAVERELGPVEVLVSNAGSVADQLLLKMRDEQFTDVLDANLVGAWRCARRAGPGMLRRRWGRLIFVSSVVALLGSSGQTNYAASKAGLIGLARSVARELGSRNITANVVAPGFVDTDMTRGLSEAHRAEVSRRIPLGRFAQPEDIAGVVRWLASDDSGYTTGAVIPVDGGLGMGH